MQEMTMLSASKLHHHLLPTQVVGAAIHATLLVLPVAKGTLLILQGSGLNRLAESGISAVIVFFACWFYLFVQFIPGATPLSMQGPPRWPKINRVLADPALPIGEKFKAVFKNWLSLLIIISTLIWVTSSASKGIPILMP
jgi:hypothetical protein